MSRCRRLLPTLTACLLVSSPLASRAAEQPVNGGTPTWIDNFQYASDAEARAAWQPMGDTAPVSRLASGGRGGLRLPCNFAGSKIERASWDRRVTLDLTACRGIEFQLRCPDAAPVSYFSLYLQSGQGWYHATFYPESTNEWDTVVLDKSDFGSEGKPAGWGKINCIRISAWRQGDQDTEMAIRSLRVTGALGRDSVVAIVRGDSLAQRSAEEGRSAARYTEIIAQSLQSSGVGFSVLSDADLTPERLKAAKVAVLPYNPDLPAAAIGALQVYARQGGKLLAFYSVPGPLYATLGVRPGNHVREPRPAAFSAIRSSPHGLSGAPARVAQHSWNIQAVEPIDGVSQPLAEWIDDLGQATGRPAIVASSHAVIMTHVLLQEDAENKARLLLAMLGRLAPEVWQQAAQAALDRIGVLGKAKNFDEAAALLQPALSQNERARKLFSIAETARRAAQERTASQDYAAAIHQANTARLRLTEAWCAAQPAAPGEFRAFWCHSAFGVDDLSWDEAMRRLAQNGFTAIVPNMLWGGAAFYQSKLLPVSPSVASRGDQIAACLAAARKHGLQVHVWKVNWNLGHEAPRAFVEEMARAGRLQANVRGEQEPWLCPSHPDNQQLELQSMLEVARNYDIDGLHFDYIRYPDKDHCFCPGCKERFERALNAKVDRWPNDVLGNGPWQSQWLDWRRSNVTAVVRAVSEQAHALKPNLKISAAVFRNWALDRDGVGQDWKLWCEQGWLDFVCPMDYTASLREFDNLVARQTQWAGRVPCYPGIGESASVSRLPVDRVIEQIQITRRYNTRGFIIFNYGVSEALELVPFLGLGITRP